MKILIPNASSPKNIGDLAILTGLLETIQHKKNIIIHSADPYLHAFKARPSLYTWAVFENRRPHVRIKRLFALFIHTSKFKKYVTRFKSGTLHTLLEDYMTADVVVFVGGGYLRSQTGVKQTLNLMMLLSMFYVVKNLKAKKIVAPISIGPFAYKWQEKMTVKVLKNFDVVAVRERYSYNLLKRYKPKNILLSTDTSLFLNYGETVKKPSNKFVLGFTIRKWLPILKQKRFEKYFHNTIIKFCKETGASIQPIVQVDAPEYGDLDRKITQKIADNLKKNKIHVLPIKKVKDLQHARNVYSSIDMLLGMRMHSNILAALCSTPFVAISYEYKTEGISNDLGVGNYCISIKKINDENLYALLKQAYSNRETIKKTMEKKIARLRLKEATRWKNVRALTT